MSYFKYIFTIAFCLAVYPSFAQPTLPDEEVEVIKDFEATLEESEKIDVMPQLPDLDTTARQLTYSLPQKNIQVEYPAPKIRPLAMRREQVPPAYNGFLKLGYGTPNRPYGEFAYKYTKDERYNIGGHLKYHSANQKTRQHQRFQDFGVAVDGTYYADLGFAVAADLGYRIDEVHFYGYDNDTRSETRNDIKQQFKTIDFGAKIFNSSRTQGDINYSAGFDLYNITDRFASKELGFKFTAEGTKWFNELHPLTIVLDADFTRFDEGITKNLNNFAMKPSFTYHGDIFKAKIGANLTSNKDKFQLFPDVEIAANVIGNQLSAYLGATGGLYKNNLKTLSDYNPFIVSRFDPTNTSYYKFYGGVKGNLRVVDYQIQAGYKIANDMALFVNDPLDTIRFNMLYDTVKIFNLEGTLEARPRKDIRVLLTLNQNFFNPSNQPETWHIPNLQFNAGVHYTTLRDKLVLRGELYAENGVHYLTTRGSDDKLGGLFDISLGATYKINKNFGLFLDINNVLNNTRERWKGYDIYGFNILGGVTAAF